MNKKGRGRGGKRRKRRKRKGKEGEEKERKKRKRIEEEDVGEDAAQEAAIEGKKLWLCK